MADESDEWEPTSLWLFVLGALVFLAGLGLFVYQLWKGIDIIAGVALNGVGAILLIVWAAKDALSDPSIEGATWSVAAGTGLVLYGLYLLGAGVVVAATGVFVHDRLTLGLLYIPLALVTVLIGFGIHRTQVEITLDEDGDDGTEADAGEDSDDESGEKSE